jgi:hypothetical protein
MARIDEIQAAARRRAGLPVEGDSARIDEGLTPLTQKAVAPFITGETLQESRQDRGPEFGTAFEDLRQALSDPQAAAAPLIQTLLQALEPGFAEERTRQADEFRRAGATSDATKAIASSKLSSSQGRRRTEAGVQGLLRFLTPLLQGRQSALASTAGPLTTSSTRSRDFGFGPQQQVVRRSSGGGGGGILRAGSPAPTGGINFAPSFSLGPQGEAVQAVPDSGAAGTPQFGATSFAPGDAFIAPGQTSFDNSDLEQFQDFSQEDTDFFFGR